VFVRVQAGEAEVGQGAESGGAQAGGDAVVAGGGDPLGGPRPGQEHAPARALE
jgi:hypothetical protein